MTRDLPDLPDALARLQRRLDALEARAGRRLAAYGHGTLGYAQVTSNQTGISTEVALTGLSVTVDVAAGRRIRVTGHGQILKSAEGSAATGNIEQDTVAVGRWCAETDLTKSMQEASVVLTPTAGSHTYRLTLGVDTGTVDLQAASAVPAFILVEDLGAT